MQKIDGYYRVEVFCRKSEALEMVQFLKTNGGKLDDNKSEAVFNAKNFDDLEAQINDYTGEANIEFVLNIDNDELALLTEMKYGKAKR